MRRALFLHMTRRNISHMQGYNKKARKGGQDNAQNKKGRDRCTR